jgi:hypothetical protein
MALVAVNRSRRHGKRSKSAQPTFPSGPSARHPKRWSLLLLSDSTAVFVMRQRQRNARSGSRRDSWYRICSKKCGGADDLWQARVNSDWRFYLALTGATVPRGGTLAISR